MKLKDSASREWTKHLSPVVPETICVDNWGGGGGGTGRGIKLKQQREQIRKSPMDNTFWKTIQIKQSRESQTPEYTRKEDADPVRENPDKDV